ncbi:MAG: ATP-binding protein [Bdellovibrionaceae bacterium]|nr:ATP-binding protein [Pseudobdellovibrionaceae bacterium]
MVLFINMISYCWVMMWFAPLYEFAYLQIAVGCSFLRLKRNWIFPLAFGIGLIGYYVNYAIQDRIGWQLPPATRSDFVWIMFIVFMLSWFIQKFAIGAMRADQDRHSRFSLIGREATRLTHDIKGLTSSPMLIVDSLRQKNRDLSLRDYENQMVVLADDMENIREVLKSIQRLVTIEDFITIVDVNEALRGPMKIFARRLAKVRLVTPEAKMIKGHPDRLHSLFFNLILNSIEAFERNSTAAPEIHMSWQENTFVFSDNAGGFDRPTSIGTKSSKGFGAGLGLDIARTDLEKMNATFRIKSVPPITRIEISFVF